MNTSTLCSSGSGGFVCNTVQASSIHRQKRTKTVICCINILHIGYTLYRLGHRHWLWKRTQYLCKDSYIFELFILIYIYIYTSTRAFICRPAGWDNMKKISILHENLQSMKANDYYRDVIAQPAINRKVCYRFVSLIHTHFCFEVDSSTFNLLTLLV